ncbi:hypothetical protein LJR161_004384 [Variovorax paradoxus]|uniref:hypothetical protein n=1 Tax=Variovorax paradoxus TaxID=34073 RepID=UPI003ECDC809
MNHVHLKNRVDPWGQLHAVSARGALMGNRGTLHDENRQIVRSWSRKPWVTCVLSFKGIRRVPFSPGSYSELFFLDEATAFAAGHRPCAACQRERHTLFKRAWFDANPLPEDVGHGVAAMDSRMHLERTAPAATRRANLARLDDLPAGTLIAQGDQAHLVWGANLLPWTFEGYGKPRRVDHDARVEVLTAPSVVAAFRLGFVPGVHVSATTFLAG